MGLLRTEIWVHPVGETFTGAPDMLLHFPWSEHERMILGMAMHFGGRWVIVNEQGVIRIERRSENDDAVLLTARVTADEGREIAALLIRRADEIDGKNEEILSAE